MLQLIKWFQVSGFIIKSQVTFEFLKKRDQKFGHRKNLLKK